MTALEVMGGELDQRGPSRELLRQLGQRVQQGASLSDAPGREYPATFSPMYVRLVRVGETGGVLETVLTQLADMMERQQELRERVKSASIYPSILLLLGMCVGHDHRDVHRAADRRGDLRPMRRCCRGRRGLLMGASAFVGSWWWLLCWPGRRDWSRRGGSWCCAGRAGGPGTW